MPDSAERRKPPRERPIKSISKKGRVVLMTRKEEAAWRKSIKNRCGELVNGKS